MEASINEKKVTYKKVENWKAHNLENLYIELVKPPLLLQKILTKLET